MAEIFGDNYNVICDVPNVSCLLFAKISNAVSAPVVLLVNCSARATRAMSSDVPARSKTLRRDER